MESRVKVRTIVVIRLSLLQARDSPGDTEFSWISAEMRRFPWPGPPFEEMTNGEWQPRLCETPVARRGQMTKRRFPLLGAMVKVPNREAQ